MNGPSMCLLNTMYTLYSGILSEKLIYVSKEKNGLSVEQKGFKPSVRGI